MKKFDVIIIGSGLGSLLCGYILSKEGMGVCILEKNKVAGGALQTFQRKGVTFDTGIHYIGGLEPGQNLHRYFHYFGLTDKLRLRRLNPDRFDVIGVEGKEYPLAQGFENFKEQLLPHFPREGTAITNYISKLQEIASVFPLYNLTVPGNHAKEQFLSQSAFEYYQRLSSSSPLLQAVLSGNNFLYAGIKEQIPLHLPALINHSFISSAWRPVEGSSQIADLLIQSIQQAGGLLITQSEVKQIDYQSATFAVTDKKGEVFHSSYLISGIHPANTIEMVISSLLRKSYTTRISNLQNTPGSFALYIVLKEKSFDYLDYNYYHQGSIDTWNQPSGQQWPGNYMLLTPDSEDSGKFAKSLVVMTTLPFEEVAPWSGTFTGKRGADYLEFKGQLADRLLARVEEKFPALRSKIAHLEISTPLTWRDYTGTPGGSMYGIQKDCHRPFETQVLPRTKVPNLFFTGQNINLHGVMGVTTGAVMTCGEIIGLNNLVNKINHG